MVWGLSVKARVRLGGKGQRGINWDNYNTITITKTVLQMTLMVKFAKVDS